MSKPLHHRRRRPHDGTARCGLDAIAARGDDSGRQSAVGSDSRQRQCVRSEGMGSERVGLSGAEPRQYCQAVSAILHWSAEDSPTPEPTAKEDGPTRAPVERAWLTRHDGRAYDATEANLVRTTIGRCRSALRGAL
jgi:hypothetical protein